MTTRIIPAEDRDSAIKSLSKLLADFLPGKPLLVSVDQHRAKRSDLQNSALWGVAYRVLRDETGNEPEDLHAYFCGEYFGWVERKIMDRKRLVPRRTTTRDEIGKRNVLPKAVFADFYGFVQRRAAEQGYDIPDPDPEWYKEG